ncbi:MAG TPA: hypothetical protein VGQ52_06575 [Gemmatimonadaceae bacterium]|jgi:hypothetical protein|nr:hypothetical protein [Gemmatimonadaceae bacterium]
MNVPRLLLGGVASGAVMWLLEGLVSQMYLGQMQTALRSHNLALNVTVSAWFWSVMIALLIGLTMEFMYVAARDRFGRGPKTAARVAVVLWLGGYVPSLIGYDMIELYPRRLLLLWGIVGLGEMIAGSVVGAWIYREAQPTAP